MKMEAMTEDEIISLIDEWDLLALTEPNTIVGKKRLAMARLIFTYATAKAEAEMWEFLTGHGYDDDEETHKALCVDPAKHDWKEADFMAAVLARIGWKEAGASQAK